MLLSTDRRYVQFVSVGVFTIVVDSPTVVVLAADAVVAAALVILVEQRQVESSWV